MLGGWPPVVLYVVYFLFATLITVNVLISTVIDLQLQMRKLSKKEKMRRKEVLRAREEVASEIREIEREEVSLRRASRDASYPGPGES